jgi:predicted ester cyclase
LPATNEVFATDSVVHAPDGSVVTRGPEGLREFFITLHSAFPNRHVTVLDLLAEGDKVAARWTQTGA